MANVCFWDVFVIFWMHQEMWGVLHFVCNSWICVWSFENVWKQLKQTKYCGTVWLFVITVEGLSIWNQAETFIQLILQCCLGVKRMTLEPCVHTPVDPVRWRKPPPGRSLLLERFPSIRSDTLSIRSSRRRPAGSPRRSSSAPAARRTLSDHNTPDSIHYRAFSHLADAFIWRDLQTRTTEAIKRAMISLS